MKLQTLPYAAAFSSSSTRFPQAAPAVKNLPNAIRFPWVPARTLQVLFGVSPLRKFRDPISRAPQVFTLNLRQKEDKLLSDLIDTPEFIRLGHISQRGLTEAEFSGDTHTRRAHSLGALKVASQVWDHLETLAQEENQPFPKALKPAFLAAALLHDVGHGPFSHTFDLALDQHHEDRTIEIILSPESKIHKLLRNFSPTLPQQIVNLLTKNDLSPEEQPFAQLLSGVFDVDKADYALRCARFTGLITTRNAYNLPTVINNLRIDPTQHKLYLRAEGLFELQAFLKVIFQVYRDRLYAPEAHFAQTEMLKIFLRRYREQMEKNPEVIPHLLPEVRSALAVKGQIPLEQYLKLDDHSLQVVLQTAQLYASDPLLKQLGGNIREAKFYQAKDLRDGWSERQLGIFQDSLARSIRQNADLLEAVCPAPELQWSIAKSSRPFLNEKAAQGLWVRMKDGTDLPLKDALSLQKPQIQRTTGFLRCYFHPALKHFVEKAFKDANNARTFPKTS